MKLNKCFYFFIVVTCLQTIFPVGYVRAQSEQLVKHDSTYYTDYPNMVTTRLYISQKYTAFTLKAPEGVRDLSYRPNTTLNLGIGVTYHVFSLNLAYGVGFLNKDDEKGDTKYLDLQGHLYPEKWSIDWYGQFYKGYYLFPKSLLSDSVNGEFYKRPDMRIHLFGIAVYRVFNSERFSYRAAIIQNEWQKKSAGTFLFGGDINYGDVTADSALVPVNLEKNYPQAGIKYIRFFSCGPGGGYAYTLVIKRHFFMTGGLSVNLNFCFSTERTILHNNHDKAYLTPTSNFRVAAGYNSNTWNVSANWVGNRLPLGGTNASNKYFLQTGNYRIILAKKIMPGPRLRKRMAYVDKIMN